MIELFPTTQTTTTPAVGSTHPPLRDVVKNAITHYLSQLQDQMPVGLYELVLTEIEAPMLETIMDHYHHNQSKVANILGLSRGTLRKKLKQYDLL